MDRTALITEFTECLHSISYCRAGWDFNLAPDVAADEARAAKTALDRARIIWAENPDAHDDLREAFKTASPLATMDEIERQPALRSA